MKSCWNKSGRRVLKIALYLAGAFFLWLIALGTMIWRFGDVDHLVKADCIVVLGAAVEGGKPSPVFEERLRHGVVIYQNSIAPKLIFTGGTGEGKRHSESSVAAAWAEQHEIPKTAYLIEEKSHTTHENLLEAKALMQANGLKSAIIVSDPLHMKRAMMMAEDLGINAVSSPTPSSRYRTLKTRSTFLLREIYFFHHYLVTGN